MAFRRFPSSRIFRYLPFLALTLVLSGCVYFRLLQLKNQLKEFDQNFKATTADGVQIDLLHPILISDDVRWLGLEPEKISQTTDSLERWDIRWVKEVPANGKEAATYDIELATFFKDDLLTRVIIPDRYFAYFPKDAFVKLLRSVGSAKINKSSREAHVPTGDTDALLDQQLPTLSSVEQMLGAPSSREDSGNEASFHYRYSPVTPTGKGKPIGVTFVFALDSGHLQKLQGKLPTGSLYYDFTSDAKIDPAKKS